MLIRFVLVFSFCNGLLVEGGGGPKVCCQSKVRGRFGMSFRLGKSFA